MDHVTMVEPVGAPSLLTPSGFITVPDGIGEPVASPPLARRPGGGGGRENEKEKEKEKEKKRKEKKKKKKKNKK